MRAAGEAGQAAWRAPEATAAGIVRSGFGACRDVRGRGDRNGLFFRTGCHRRRAADGVLRGARQGWRGSLPPRGAFPPPAATVPRPPCAGIGACQPRCAGDRGPGASQCADAQHPRDGRADHHGHGAGGENADRLAGHHHRRRRPDQCQLQLPVDFGGRHGRGGHLRRDWRHLHPERRRRGQEDQGESELHRRRGERRESDQRADGDRRVR